MKSKTTSVKLETLGKAFSLTFEPLRALKDLVCDTFEALCEFGAALHYIDSDGEVRARGLEQAQDLDVHLACVQVREDCFRLLFFFILEKESEFLALDHGSFSSARTSTTPQTQDIQALLGCTDPVGKDHKRGK